MDPRLPGLAGELVAVAFVLVVCAFMYRASLNRSGPAPAPTTGEQ
jgi:hypothetical protein